ncbi:MAG: TonB-dependent receptor plug domain-containing protein, partial [Gemmatimonadota bacterium]|nr:TonB-dependent receptor plug domain-containing protein [Gemmatimonadota bacterium]
LQRARARRLRVHGQVRDPETQNPVAYAMVGLNGAMFAMTETDGTFDAVVDTATVGLSVLSVRHIGHRPLDVNVQVPDDSIFHFNVELSKLPIQLEPIVISAEQTIYANPRMREFYERRHVGSGTYFTADDIEKLQPASTTSLFHHVPGASIAEDPNDPANRIVSFQRGGFGCRGKSTLIFLDGVLLPRGGVAMDAVTRPERLAGVEVYTGPASIPVMYNPTGSACGVILLWSK